MNLDQTLLPQLEQLYDLMLERERQHHQYIQGAEPHYRNSAINLVDYMSLRSTNIEGLQYQLHNAGLSSLSSSESHIKWQVLQVMKWLGHTGEKVCEVDAEGGAKRLLTNVGELLGTADENTIPVMVTFDTHFADDLDLVCDLLQTGMRVARINCAHDDTEIWHRMIVTLNKAKQKMNLPCKLYIDMAGPKIRTQISTSKHKHGKLKVSEGDELVLTDLYGKHKKKEKIIQCTLPGIIENLEPKQRIFFDDGLIEASVEEVDVRAAIIRIIRISANKPLIKSEKGINFPDTDFTIDPITDYDRKCLPFIAKHADMIGFSFVNTPEDIRRLQNELAGLQRPDLPIVAKIETRKSIEHLPEIILQGMQQGQIGVMVARGDMGIELGFERMSEIQDEILWICEAAHVPVIWATQVLESLNKKGMATRAEITDAAHAAQADCVMINKGDFTLKVLQTLNDILARSRRNNYKNRRLFRQLSIANRFFERHKAH